VTRPGRPQADRLSTTVPFLAHAGPPDGRVGVVSRLLIVLALAVAAFVAPAPASAAPPSVLWGLPLVGPPAVTRPFQPPPTPYAAGHRGVDLAGVPGQPVVAAGAGVVAFAGLVGGRPVVSVQHADGLRTTYEPVQPGVAAGQVVARGSPLGVLVAGHAGCPVEACLHWGLRRGEVYLDPLSLLRPPRVRLLPWH
jgi:murein DD-endopeptidase MepM/ murein hydrolase activator NlpD